MKQNKHIGSNFDDFLEQEGILKEIEEEATKRISVFLAEKEQQDIDKTKLNEKGQTISCYQSCEKNQHREKIMKGREAQRKK